MLPQPEYYVSRRRSRRSPSASGAFGFALSLVFLIVWFCPFVPVEWVCNIGIGAFVVALFAKAWK